MEQTNQNPSVSNSGLETNTSVLSHSSNIYKDIRQYLKQEVVEVSQVQRDD